MNEVLITLDIDWAPDFVIDFVAERLERYQVPATWFVTHLSPAIERLQQYPDLFELGIHPNFLPGSTQGDMPDTILNYCMKMMPEATSIRTHGLVQSTQLLESILTQTPLTTDVSLYLPYTPHLQPVEYWWRGRTLLRIPYFWEDDFEMERPTPNWHLTPLLTVGEGLKVFDFHPIHIYLNSADMAPYQALKHRRPTLSEINPAEAKAYVQTGMGTQTMFIELIEHIARADQLLRIKDIYKGWQIAK